MLRIGEMWRKTNEHKEDRMHHSPCIPGDDRYGLCGTGTYRIKFSGFSRQHAYAHYCLVPKDAAYYQVRISWWICLP